MAKKLGNSKHAHWEHAGSLSCPSHHRVSLSTGRFWLAGVMGRGSANISGHREMQTVPLLPPQHPKTRQGQGHPDAGHPQNHKAGRRKPQALSP